MFYTDIEFDNKEDAIKFLENYMKGVNFRVEYLYPDKYENK